MANKVIQLKNKAGTDNLFPIAGGVTQDTITTAMIQDDAVTKAKIVGGTNLADKDIIVALTWDSENNRYNWSSSTSWNDIKNAARNASRDIVFRLDGNMSYGQIWWRTVRPTTVEEHFDEVTLNYVVKARINAPTAFPDSQVDGDFYRITLHYNGIVGLAPRETAIYASLERNTFEKWTDGKYIYRKTYTIPLVNNAAASVSTGITGLDKFIKFEGIMTNSTSDQWWDLSYPGADIEATASNIAVYCRQDLTGFTATVTAYYTKSSS